MVRSRLKIFFSLTASTVFALGLIIFPSETAESVRNSASVCAKSVIPSLFPFFVVSKFLVSVPLPNRAKKIFGRLMSLFSLKASLAPALILGLIGGYPVGASSAAELYNEGLCTKAEAERLLAFCNNCGPAFIVGAVGYGIFSSARIGLILFLIHIFSALAVGVLFAVFSPISCTGEDRPRMCAEFRFSKAFTGAVSSALFSVLAISAYIVLFSVIVKLLNLMYVLPAVSAVLSSLFRLPEEFIASILSGITEVTVGAYSVAECFPFRVSFPAISFFLGWGGLSVHCQTMSCIGENGLSLRQYFSGKLLHAVLSLIFACGIRSFL